MELAHAALEEATKEEDAKGVVQELLERFLARTGAPLMAGAIADQLRSQEVIEQLAEQSFERRLLQQQHSLKKSHHHPSSSLKPKAILSTTKIRKPTSLPITTTTTITTSSSSSTSTSTSPLLQMDEKQNRNRTISLPSKKDIHLIPSNTSSTLIASSSESLSSLPTLLKQSSPSIIISKDSLSETSDETVIRDHFVINDDSPSTMSHSGSSSTERLLLISEYMWRVFRLLLLASIVGLVYHYVCSFPQHQIYF
ncbi:unnamed protein product [Cunninghamella blakesleeana]